MTIIEKIGFVASVALPLWNIPLIIKVAKRKSAGDISLTWVLGVWACIILMFPCSLMSQDITWKVFNMVNFVLFTGVVVVVLKYRKRT